MSNTAKQVLYTVFFLVTFTGLIYLYLYFTDRSLPYSEVIITATTIVALIVAYVIIKIRRRPIVEIIKPEDQVYKIFLVGRAGVGKTTFIKTGFSYEDTSTINSTDYFKVSKNIVPITLKESQGEIDINIKVADYRGQDPNQIVHDLTNDAQSEFFNPKANSGINAIVFIVDLFPRGLFNDEILDSEALLEFFKTDTSNKIAARVQENESYIGDAALPIFFRTANGSRLKSARLVINKVNLLEELVSGGYISLGEDSAEEYAKKLYEDMSNKVAKVCEDLKIDDFSTIVVSAKNANDTRSLVSGLLSKYGDDILQKYQR